MELLTERLALREFEFDDFDRLFEYENDVRYLEYYEQLERSKEWVLSLLNIFIEWKNETPRTKYQLAVELKKTHVLIGSVGIRFKENRNVDIGYELDPNYWGNGYAIEALTEILQYGKNNLSVRTVNAYCNPYNSRSINLLQKIGFIKIRIERVMDRYRDEQKFELDLTRWGCRK